MIMNVWTNLVFCINSNFSPFLHEHSTIQLKQFKVNKMGKPRKFYDKVVWISSFFLL